MCPVPEQSSGDEASDATDDSAKENDPAPRPTPKFKAGPTSKPTEKKDFHGRPVKPIQSARSECKHPTCMLDPHQHLIFLVPVHQLERHWWKLSNADTNVFNLFCSNPNNCYNTPPTQNQNQCQIDLQVSCLKIIIHIFVELHVDRSVNTISCFLELCAMPWCKNGLMRCTERTLES